MNYDDFKAKLDAIAPDRFEKDDDHAGSTLSTITGDQIGLWIPRSPTHQFFVEFDDRTIGAGSTVESALDQALLRLNHRQALLKDAIDDIMLMRQALRPASRQEDDQC